MEGVGGFGKLTKDERRRLIRAGRRCEADLTPRPPSLIGKGVPLARSSHCWRTGSHSLSFLKRPMRNARDFGHEGAATAVVDRGGVEEAFVEHSQDLVAGGV